MKTIKTYQNKLYRNKRNRHLDEAIDTAASIWNYCIAFHRRYYKLYGKHLSANKLKKHITKVKRTPHPEWQVLGSQAIQDVVERVDRSYKAFFEHHKQERRGRKSPPSFKKRRKYSSFTVKRNALGEFFLNVVCEIAKNEVLPRAGKAAGYDFGLKHFLTADDGSTIDSPEWYKILLEELCQSHRAVSRCQKGSNNRRRAVLHLNRVYQKIVNRRRDWFFKLANQLVGENATICIEDLNLDGMKCLWGRKVSDYAFAEFIGILEYVASEAGTTAVKIDRWASSSKVCHVCGGRNDALALKDREWICPQCGAHLDRDVNAAINIKNIGAAMLSA